MLNYELCLKLKEAGFPQMGDGFALILDKPLPESDQTVSRIPWERYVYSRGFEAIYEPTLSELIEACGEKHPKYQDFEFSLVLAADEWCSGYMDENMETALPIGKGHSPEEAVANLNLSLNPTK